MKQQGSNFFFYWDWDESELVNGQEESGQPDEDVTRGRLVLTSVGL